jgi:RNA 3'-terminal phosphate cyclase (ATP)
VALLSIDGSQGEGGGQILRTSLTLSALTGQAIRIENVRANRSRPGLLRQHLTALTAAGQISGADVAGAKPRSRVVSFEPKGIFGGNYRFSVGTAGSACLVLQTILYPLLFADGPSSVVLEGGTHNAMSPPFHFIEHTFLPLLRRMGADVTVRLERYGFYPAGGGRIMVAVRPLEKLRPIELVEAGDVSSRRARAIISRLPRHIAERELGVLRERLGLEPDECEIEKAASPGPGNALMLHLERSSLTETFTAFGEKGVPAERVAATLAHEVEGYLAAGVPVGEHLADQLIIPFVLAGGGAFATTDLSLHATTNIDVVDRLLGLRPLVSEADGHTRIEVPSTAPFERHK